MLYKLLTDGTAADVPTLDLSDSAKNIKDFAGKNITSYWLDIATPSDLDLIQIKDQSGAILHEAGGAINAALGQVPRVEVNDISIPIDKGTVFEVTTSD